MRTNVNLKAESTKRHSPTVCLLIGQVGDGIVMMTRNGLFQDVGARFERVLFVHTGVVEPLKEPGRMPHWQIDYCPVARRNCRSRSALCRHHVPLNTCTPAGGPVNADSPSPDYLLVVVRKRERNHRGYTPPCLAVYLYNTMLAYFKATLSLRGASPRSGLDRGSPQLPRSFFAFRRSFQRRLAGSGGSWGGGRN